MITPPMPTMVWKVLASSRKMMACAAEGGAETTEPAGRGPALRSSLAVTKDIRREKTGHWCAW